MTSTLLKWKRGRHKKNRARNSREKQNLAKTKILAIYFHTFQKQMESSQKIGIALWAVCAVPTGAYVLWRCLNEITQVSPIFSDRIGVGIPLSLTTAVIGGTFWPLTWYIEYQRKNCRIAPSYDISS